MTHSITIDLPDSIAKKVSGKVVTIDATRVNATTVAWIFAYGLRKLGDTVNGAKKAAKDDPDLTTWSNADLDSAIDAVVAKLYDGTICVTSSGSVDPVEKVMRQIARTDWLATLPTDKRKDARALDASAIKTAMDTIIAADPEGYKVRAESEIARRAAEAKSRAEAIAGAMNAVNAAKIDLTALLNKV